MDLLERLFTGRDLQAPLSALSSVPDSHGHAQFVAPMEAEPQSADGLEGRDPGEAALLRTCQKQAASSSPELEEGLSNERFLEAEEDYPFDVESEEGRYGK